MTQINNVAKAIYESMELKKPWDHPDTWRIWHPICKKYARIAIEAVGTLKTEEKVDVA